MASGHQHSSGSGKRTRFLNRLFPWRSSSSQRSSSGSRMMSGGHNKESPGQLFSGSSTSSVRRTSPVDLNLGAETSVGPPMMAVPSSLPIPRFPDVVEAEPAVLLASHHRRTQRHKDGANGFRMTATAAAPSTYQQHQTADKMDHEEMGALRHLASELNAALRLSEEENLLLKAKLQTLDEWGLMAEQQEDVGASQTAKLDRLIEDLRDIASSQPTSPFTSPFVHRRNMRDLGRILQQRQSELRRLTAELHQTQTELLFTQVELDQVRRCLQRLDQRLLYAEEELDLARQGLLQASISKQRLMQELQTTRGLLMRCWGRVRDLEQQQQAAGNMLEAS
ncbi:uncharacterized protein LOC116924506 [Daphnia magna]|uniref:Uncharacterized protein n=1 Tax=Daphnia magna TaxID=35525 RepID=A0ABQ9ZRL0_9CRUS|nr:uncharacterized protein LOC116924506 [Daphnia magna]KAK4015413.1 hypothetical protein OUZ56_030393 [Daphnia magna]